MDVRAAAATEYVSTDTAEAHGGAFAMHFYLAAESSDVDSIAAVVDATVYASVDVS